MALTTLVFVPGLWEGTSVFELLREILAKASPPIIDCYSAPLRSTGTTSPGNPNLKQDVDGIRVVLEPLVKAGKRVVIVAHSAGGFLGSEAVEGLEVGGKNTGGNGGGVEKMFFIAAALFRAGYEHRDLPFMDFQGDKMFCKDLDWTLFNDVPAEVAAKYKLLMQHQPGGNWNGVTTYAGWENIPSAYLLCENDACVPLSWQQSMAEAAKCTIFTANLGHMAMLAEPNQVADKLLKFIKG